MTKKKYPIPAYVARQYEGGARGFREEKRRHLRAFAKAYVDLRTGCAFFPRLPKEGK